MPNLTQPEIIVIPGYKGGLSNDMFSPLSTQTFQKAENLELFTNQVIATANLGLVSDTINSADINKVKPQNAYLASDANTYFTGFDSSAGTTGTLWQAGTITSSTVLTSVDSTLTSGFGKPIEFQGNGTRTKLFYYSSPTNLRAYTLFTGGASTMSSLVSNMAPPFVHEGFPELFYTTAVNAIGGSLTADAITTTPLITFDTTQQIVNMCPYNQYVAIGLKTNQHAKTSKIGIWDGSSTKLSDFIEIPDIGLQGIANVEGKLVALCISNPAGFATNNVLRIYVYSYGKLELVQQYDLLQTLLTTTPASISTSSIVVQKGIVYFGFQNATVAGVLGVDNGMYGYDVASNLLHLAKTTPNGPTAISVDSISFTNGFPWISSHNSGSNYELDHTPNVAGTSPYANCSPTYESNAFFLDDGGKKLGRIKSITINHLPLQTGQGFTLKHKSDQESNWVTCNIVGSPNPSSKNSYTISRTESRNSVTQGFPLCRSEQLQIVGNLVSTLGSASIIFPIIVEVDTTQNIG